MSKRMVKNAWERSYRCNKVFKPICFSFGWDVEVYQGWFGSIGSIFFLATAARIFRYYACVCFLRRANKKGGLRWCLFLLYQPTSMNKRQIANLCLNVQRRFLLNTLKISLKMLPFFTRFSSLRSRVTTDAPYTTLLPGWPSHRKDPLSATFNMNLSTHLCVAFIQVGLIDPQTKCVIIRLMLARNDLTGVFLDRHGWFDRPLGQSLRCFGLTYMVTCIVCIQCFH